MSKPTTRWRITPAAWAGIALAFLAEASANALRAYGLGAHEAEYTIAVHGYSVSVAGAVMVLFAVALSLSQSRAAWVALEPGRSVTMRLLGGFVAAVLIFVSACAMSSVMLKATRATGASETHERGAFDRAEAAYKAAKADFDKVKDAETVEAVEARIAGLRIDASIWRRSNECRDAAKKAVWQNECQPFFKLQPALAAAQTKADLQSRLPDLQAKLDAAPRPEKASDAEAFVNEAWSWAAALAIILVATVGPALFASEVQIPISTPEPEPDTAAKPETKRPTDPKGGRRGRKRDAKVVVSFADAFRTRYGRSPSGAEIRAEFPELPKSTAYDYATRTRKSR